MSDKRTYTSTDLENRLAAKYRSDSAEILFGVRNDAGFNANRTADAIAVGLWPSTGCSLEGFEIKVSRGDWLRELKDGSKSAAFLEHMDFWWLVAPREIVNDDELPPTWGLMVPHGDSLRVARQAKRNPAPAPMPRGMLAALVKRASTKKARDAEIAAARRDGIEQGKRSLDANYDAQRLHDLEAAIVRFRDGTGINPLYVYDNQLGELKLAYTLVRSGGHATVGRRLAGMAKEVETLAGSLRSAAAEIENAAASVEVSV